MTHKANCRILTEVLAAHGVKRVVCSPGSRNAPLLVAADEEPRLRTTVIIDERTAGFVALGLAQASNAPVALVCTSGTALLNYAPAVAEAYYQGLPLIVVSADRPERWIDQDDSQTLRQPGALANFVKRSVDLPDVMSSDRDMMLYVNRLVNDAMIEATRRRRGPVHINVRLNEPLSGQKAEPLPPQRIVRCLEADDILPKEQVRDLAREAAGRRILVVAGFMLPDARLNKAMTRLAALPNVYVMAETISNLHLKGQPSAIDVILSTLGDELKEEMRPDLVISLGGAIVSRQIKEYLRSFSPEEHWALGHQHTTVDCFNSLTLRVEADPGRFLSMLGKFMGKQRPQSGYAQQWLSLRKQALETQAQFIASSPWSDMTAFETLLSHLPSTVNLQLSNGTSIRYAQLLTRKIHHACFCNRGVSGIAGSVATAVGAAMVYPENTVLVTGDMTMAYGIGALSLHQLPERLKIIVMSNGGGAIFRFVGSTASLPQREQYFCAAPNLPLRDLCKAYGLEYMRAESQSQLLSKLPSFFAPRLAPTLLEIVTDGEVSASILRNYMNRTKI